MPQITVNEIDQSVVTRVVTDDKVKILCPIIASFGPAYDGTQESIKTFTDVTDFNRAFGYTYAEFNPFQDDHSRMYARELIKKGAAVSVVRVNNGFGASLNIDGIADRKTSEASINTVCPAALKESSLQKLVKSGSVVSGTSTHTNVVPGTVALKVVNSTVTYDAIEDEKTGTFYATLSGQTTTTKAATIDYSTGTITPETGFTCDGCTFDYIDTSVTTVDWKKYTFAPQIESIVAKYPGSFGNNLAISIAQVNTSRLAESYQYASISVYYVDKIVNYTTDSSGKTTAQENVKSVLLLENKLVSTNPDSPNYFEDVEFDFIKIIGSASARQDLSIVWSNINASPLSASQYSGFPVIPLKYKPTDSYAQVYNFDAFCENGADFAYSTATLAKLRNGFKGYWTGTGWTVADVNKYLEEVYGRGSVGDDNYLQGIIPSIYTTLSTLYDNYTDPYIYDFDFITSSGFVYTESKLVYQSVKETVTPTTSGDNKVFTLSNPAGAGSISFRIAAGQSFVNCVDDGEGHIKTTDGASYGTVDYDGTTENPVCVITMTSSAVGSSSCKITYGNANLPKIAEITVPESVSTDGNNTSYYTEITPIHQSMLNLVNTRQDCIALFDVPVDYDPQQIVYYSYILNTSYGTIHNPWCYVNSPDIAGQEILMAPSYIFLYTFLSNLINNVESPKWFPPAGVERATARVVTRPYYEIGSVILNDWQNDNISRVNPIMKLKQYGYVIYGQYTTLPAIDLYTHSALESLNVRLISNVVKKKIFDTCLNLAFEPNTSALWLKFFAQLDPFLRYMKYNDGLYDYRIVMDESTVTTDDINHLRCPGKVYIAPTRTAEFFDIDFIITDAGAVFSD